MTDLIMNKPYKLIREERNIKGKNVTFPAIEIDNVKIIVKGKYIKIAEVRDEWDNDINDPERYAKILKNSGLHADIFTFIQRLPDSRPKFDYEMEWDNVAAVPIVSYDHWSKKQIPKQTRNRLKKGKKAGVKVKKIGMNDDLFKGISEIYNETPVRQGKKNWHYNMKMELVKKLNSTFSDRCDFIGAFYKEELIGYIKLVYTDKYARTMGILRKVKYRDKYPMNLLIAKAIEICSEKKIPYLVYARYDYGKVGSTTLQDFKKNCGFEYVILPRYYMPITIFGKIMLTTGLYKGLKAMLPKQVLDILIEARRIWYEKK